MHTPLESLADVMIKNLAVVGLLFVASVAACSKQDTPASPPEPTAERRDADATQPEAPTGTAAIDACRLLSPEEIASVQGEAPARTQLVGDSEGELTVSQCNFMLPAGPNSLAVRVVERGNGPKARDPREVWQETFHAPPPDAADARYTRQHQKVEGVGEEAFWLGNAKSGGLHVLAGSRFIRVNVGGQEDVPAKIAKCSKLAQFVLPRLDAAK